MSEEIPESVTDGVPDLDDGPTYCTYTEYREGEVPEGQAVPATGEGATGREREVWEALYDVEDPEMPISIVDLGLVYGVTVEDDRVVVDMTLTYSGCPARTMLIEDVEASVGSVEGVADVEVRLVWSPEWSIEMVTEQGRTDLEEFGLSVPT